MTQELKPCPFCGGDNVSLADTGSCWVRCHNVNCDCEGPVCENEQDAIHAWNVRVLVGGVAQRQPVWWRWRFRSAALPDDGWSKWIALHDAEGVAAFKELQADHLARGSVELEPLYAAPAERGPTRDLATWWGLLSSCPPEILTSFMTQRKLDASVTPDQAAIDVRREREWRENQGKQQPQPDGFINDYD